MKRPALSILLALALSSFGCAPRATSDFSPRGVESQAQERESNQEALAELMENGEGARTDDVPVLPVTVLEPPPSPAELGEGVMQRDELNNYLDQGPHRLLRTVEVEAMMEGSSFRGFLISLIHPDAGPIIGSGLREGDIVTSINGLSIGRPEDFITVWESMREADHLNVDLFRDGNAQTLQWQIVEN